MSTCSPRIILPPAIQIAVASLDIFGFIFLGVGATCPVEIRNEKNHRRRALTRPDAKPFLVRGKPPRVVRTLE